MSSIADFFISPVYLVKPCSISLQQSTISHYAAEALRKLVKGELFDILSWVLERKGKEVAEELKQLESYRKAIVEVFT